MFSRKMQQQTRKVAHVPCSASTLAFAANETNYNSFNAKANVNTSLNKFKAVANSTGMGSLIETKPNYETQKAAIKDYSNVYSGMDSQKNKGGPNFSQGSTDGLDILPP
mmetsp:Transcript_41777/g.63795  ORF Transcript_41777/g.63795 Transcript_41777/m.63795 type:complete len:109 (+) Transcript_41777:295-621(+)